MFVPLCQLVKIRRFFVLKIARGMTLDVKNAPYRE